MKTFIVAEISKNWAEETPVEDLLSNRFEEVININHERGYKLIDWKMNSIINTNNTTLNETIIAIFQKIEK